jgi:hypothetical protein
MRSQELSEIIHQTYDWIAGNEHAFHLVQCTTERQGIIPAAYSYNAHDIGQLRSYELKDATPAAGRLATECYHHSVHQFLGQLLGKPFMAPQLQHVVRGVS